MIGKRLLKLRKRFITILLEKVRRNKWLVLILSGVGILLFANLGNHYLWMDEADTAILARSILKKGLPYAWDGKNLVIFEESGAYFTSKFLWNLHPWLQHYITALSFSIFGEKTWSARAPFALLGWWTIFFLYLLTCRITSNKTIGLLAAFFLAISIPFILYMRQCRYYALLTFFSFPLIYSYYKIPEKRHTFFFLLYSLLLFFSHYLFMITFLLGLAVYFFIFDFSLKKFKHLFCSALTVFFTATLWAVSTDLWLTIDANLIAGGRQAFSTSFMETVRKQLSFLINLNMTAIPLSVLVFALTLFFLKRGKVRAPRLYILLMVVILVNMVLIPLTGIHPERYSVGLIPLFCVLMAMMCYEIFISHKIVGSLFISIFLFTNVFNEFPALCGKPILSLMPVTRDKLSYLTGCKKINPLRKDIKEALMGKRYYLDFLYEITHNYDGPMEGIVEFLNHNAGHGDIVLTPYGQFPIAFYCHHKNIRLAKVVEDKEEFLVYHPPGKVRLPDYLFSYADLDWFIPRTYWPGRGYAEEEVLHYIEKRGWKWKRLEIPYPDIAWENRPELRLHNFRTVKGEPGIVIYKVDKEKE